MGIAAGAWLLLAGAACAADDEDGGGIKEKVEVAKEKTLNAVERGWEYAKKIHHEGDNVLYLSGYAYHGRNTYSPEKIAEFNEEAWGAGFGRTLVNAKGNTDSLFALAFLDSHDDVQAQVGYAHEWRWQFLERGAVGLGYTAMLVSRSDMFNNIPFPAVLPIVSAEIRPVAIMATYIPTFGGGSNGNVLYIFGRINLGR
jgi:palmitoyl transferase